jgi:hypothetical protein
MNAPQKSKRQSTPRAVKNPMKRRRCQNCNKLYTPTRDDQKFCRELPDKDKCRKEFYRYGSSYGPLKTGLEKAIQRKYGLLVLDVEIELKRLAQTQRVRLSQLEIDVKMLRFNLNGLTDRIAALEFVNVERAKLKAKQKSQVGQTKIPPDITTTYGL